MVDEPEDLTEFQKKIRQIYLDLIASNERKISMSNVENVKSVDNDRQDCLGMVSEQEAIEQLGEPVRQKENVPPPLETDDRLQSISTTMLGCRLTNHHWEWQTDEVVERKNGSPVVFRSVFACEQCSTVRRDVIETYTWTLVSRTYSYEPDYLVPGVGINKQKVRREFYTRRNSAFGSRNIDASGSGR